MIFLSFILIFAVSIRASETKKWELHSNQEQNICILLDNGTRAMRYPGGEQCICYPTNPSPIKNIARIYVRELEANIMKDILLKFRSLGCTDNDAGTREDFECLDDPFPIPFFLIHFVPPKELYKKTSQAHRYVFYGSGWINPRTPASKIQNLLKKSNWGKLD